MTSEIAIMNNQAIALATDSAVTINEGKKIYNSANKLFCLSKYHPIGIMIYGNATFMNIPYETIIKMFRESLAETKCDKLDGYAKKFINFLNENKIGVSKKQQQEYIESVVSIVLNDIKKEIENQWEKEIQKNGKISQDKAKNISSIVIKHFKDKFTNTKLSCFSAKFLLNLEKKIGILFIKKVKEIFQQYPFSKSDIRILKEVINRAITKGNFPPWFSGIVIAGFGEKEIFPGIEFYKIEALIDGKLKYNQEKIENISLKNKAAIIPFAQSEMVATFMEGVDPNYRKFKRSFLENIFENYPDIIIKNSKKLNKLEKKDKDLIHSEFKSLSKQIYKDYIKKMTEFTRKNHVNQVLSVVGILPKDELAAMAESLVNLTSFKRRVTMTQETVGGPIDVAVISKGDGFIWIKRKHYFKPELNHHFFDNYFRTGGDKK